MASGRCMTRKALKSREGAEWLGGHRAARRELNGQDCARWPGRRVRRALEAKDTRVRGGQADPRALSNQEGVELRVARKAPSSLKVKSADQLVGGAGE